MPSASSASPEDEIGLVGLPLSFDDRRPPSLHAVRDIRADCDKLGEVLERRP
ncbi:hypothetical protein ACFCWG_29195 [Streptomyces sp. NPDC056390]|uniref:hypothetical protein n=1 Tax=Streptomyces sp. NPDC056390 TaxID=3345806 RepID=UPI0035DEB926